MLTVSVDRKTVYKGWQRSKKLWGETLFVVTLPYCDTATSG